VLIKRWDGMGWDGVKWYVMCYTLLSALSMSQCFQAVRITLDHLSDFTVSSASKHSRIVSVRVTLY